MVTLSMVVTMVLSPLVGIEGEGVGERALVTLGVVS